MVVLSAVEFYDREAFCGFSSIASLSMNLAYSRKISNGCSAHEGGMTSAG